MEKVIDKLVAHLPHEMNILKVVEECAELQEVLVKYLTKSEETKPKKEKIIEEMGDTVFRIVVASRMLDIEVDVQQRMEFKARQLDKWISDKIKN